MTGSKKDKSNLKAVGYGFAGLDLIKSGTDEIFLPGGTCANVMSVLTHLGWRTTIIKSAYSDIWNDYVDSVWNSIGVAVNNCHKSKLPTPRVVQEFLERKHFFYTTCPKCKTQLLNIELPAKKFIEESITDFDYDILFYDRVSAGIRYLLEICNSAGKWTFYEPNSVRSYSNFVSNVAECDIVKFSDKRVPPSVTKKLLFDLEKISAKTKLVIVTHENRGMSYSILKNSNYSEYVFLPVKPLAKITDSSGAGDWLSAGFINNFISIYPTVTDCLDEDAVKSALHMGHIQAKRCCSSIGAIGGLIGNKKKSGKIYLPESDSGCRYCKI